MIRLGDLPGPLQDRARPCWKKQRHGTRGAAEAQMRSLLRRESEGWVDGAWLNVYRCPDCHGWHVGRQWKTRRREGPAGPAGEGT